MAYSTTRELIADSEDEIFKYAAAEEVEPHDLEPLSYDDIVDLDMDQPEGWDGDPLPFEEQVHTTLYGRSVTGFDRPLQLAEDMSLQDAIEERDAEIASLRQINAELAHRADPHRRQRAAQAREQAMYDIVANPEQAANAIVGLHTRNQELAESRVNASMYAAHARHGREFTVAYQNLLSMNPQHPAARALVQSIYNADDPGIALMDWHQSTGGRPIPVAVGGGARMPPSLNSLTPGSGGRSRRPQGRSSSEWPASINDEATFDPRAEREVAAAMFEDI